jgi:hypothetical protein
MAFLVKENRGRAGTIDQEMALAFAKMSKSSALNRLYAAKVKREGNILLSKLLYSISRSEKIQDGGLSVSR